MGESEHLSFRLSPDAAETDRTVPRPFGSWGTLKPDGDPDRPHAMAFSDYSGTVVREWNILLATDPTERAVQSFLELHPSMIPGGSGDVGPAGHHGSEFSAVFREPELKGDGPSYKPDFMWVTRSTARITPILIEIERPSKEWFKTNGRPTADFRDAHDQLNEWRSWFDRDENVALFRKRFLLGGDYDRRPLDPQFLLIYGRRSEFQPGGGHADPENLLRKRDSQLRRGEAFMTFDSLRPRYDHSNSITITMTATGPQPFAFSPVYGTGPHGIEATRLLGDPADAFDRSQMMTLERKAYLRQRWSYWRQVAIEIQDGRRGNGPRSTGLE